MKNIITIGIDARLWNETGVGRYIRNLVFQLAQIDKKNTYILFFRKKEFNEIVVPGENFEKRLADVRWHTVTEQITFLKLINKENIDLMHFPYFSIPLFYKRPYVITIHDLILHHFATGKATTKAPVVYYLKRLFYKRLMAHAALWSKKIIAVSQATKQEIMDHLHAPEGKIAVTYEGVDSTITNVPVGLRLRGSDSRSRQVSDYQSKNYFLYVGNAYPHKNLERLIEAFALFKKQGENDVMLILVGKDDYFYKRLKRDIGERSLDASIQIKNNVTDEKLALLYQEAIALVIPSLMEGFGLPALEAMAQHCLVLASKIPSLQEICLNNAIYFDPFAISDIAQKLSMVYNKTSQFVQQKKDGAERAKMFSWRSMAEQTLEIYESSARI